MRLLFAVVLFLFSFQTVAQVDPAKMGLHHTSELGYIVVGGNAKSTSLSAKQETWYQFTNDLVKLKGHYLRSTALNRQTGEVDETAKNWSAALRWEHIYTPDKFSVFAESGVLGNEFIGLEIGQQHGVGVKYYLMASETFKWFAEFGYQYLKEDFIAGATADYKESHFARLYSKAEYTYSPSIKFAIYGEYLPDINDSENYRVNFGPEMLAVLSETFSLKFGYEGFYRNIPVAPNTIRMDFRHTTALIANF
ncbi:MAG: DUF481 domain-containing protein [Bdellovibrionaceae bacterium]|nr:DUF481 domain-containing protein [Pseudobdellovibrionaceae bacterium]